MYNAGAGHLMPGVVHNLKTGAMKAGLISFLLLTNFAFSFGQNLNQDSLVSAPKKLPTGNYFLNQDSSIANMIMGKWRDQNSTIIFKKKRKFETKYDTGKKDWGTWEVKNGKLIFAYEILSMSQIVLEHFEEYAILYFSPKRFDYKAINSSDTTIWIANKIE